MVKIIKWVRGYFVFVGVTVTCLVGLLIWFARQPTMTSFEVLPSDAKALLHWKLEGPLLEHSVQTDPLRVIFNRYMGRASGFYLPELESVLQKASEDPRVKGLFLEYGDLTGGLASLTEFKDLLARFRKSGKPIYMWSPYVHTKQLYLASQADEFRAPPSADVEITGLQMPSYFVFDLLGRLGVHVDVVRVGRYKSLFEGMTNTQLSPETKEEYESLVSAFESHAVDTIANSVKRQNTKSEVQSWFKESIFLPQDMLGRKVVSELGFLSDWQEALQREQKLSFHPFEEYAEETKANHHPAASLAKAPGGVALIEAVGKIQMEGSPEEDVVSPQAIRDQVEWALAADEVKSVLLRISSQGGSFLASDLIWRDIQKLAAKKPLVVSFGDVAASGGYYIAAPGTKIFAEPTTITGSIGIVMMKPSFDGVSEKFGIHFDIVSHSDRKNIYNPGTRPSSVDLSYLQKSADHGYRMFISRVSEGRKLSPEAVDQVAQGRVWLGIQAKERGLVDAIGGFHEALAEAKALGKFDPKAQVPLLQYEKSAKNFWECLRTPRGGLARCVSESRMSVSLKAVQNEFLTEESKALLQVKSWIRQISEDRIQALYLGGKF